MSRKLLDHYNVHGKLVSCHQKNELARWDMVREEIAHGRHVALVSDAGAPGVSDPGARLVDRAREAREGVADLMGDARGHLAECRQLPRTTQPGLGLRQLVLERGHFPTKGAVGRLEPRRDLVEGPDELGELRGIDAGGAIRSNAGCERGGMTHADRSMLVPAAFVPTAAPFDRDCPW